MADQISQSTPDNQTIPYPIDPNSQGAIANTVFKMLQAQEFRGRFNPRVNSIASSATPSIPVDDTDMFTITALAAAITSMSSGLMGIAVNGQKLIIRFKDDGTARAITWGASFASRGATLPTTTVLGKYMYVGLIYNSTTSTWDCVSVVNET